MLEGLSGDPWALSRSSSKPCRNPRSSQQSLSSEREKKKSEREKTYIHSKEEIRWNNTRAKERKEVRFYSIRSSFYSVVEKKTGKVFGIDDDVDLWIRWKVWMMMNDVWFVLYNEMWANGRFIRPSFLFYFLGYSMECTQSLLINLSGSFRFQIWIQCLLTV